MDYAPFIRRLPLPPGFEAPRELAFEDIRATALTREHLRDDVNGINESLELIRQTRGGRWPSGPVTETGNYVDLVWHEAEFRDGDSFTYVLHDAGGRYLGCCYLYPMGRRTRLTEALLHHDVDVSWWVTPAAYAQGHYAKVYAALRRWLADAFPFTDPYYSNHNLPTAAGGAP